jgi:hypothetical protein
LNWPGFCGLCWPRGFWFRIYGYGLHVKLAKGHQMLFSGRYGYRKPLYLLGLRIEWLKR